MRSAIKIVALLYCAFSSNAATIVADSASTADVQTAVSAASTGDRVELPSSPGTVTWITNVNIGNKLITIDGKGWTIVDDNPSRSGVAGAMFYVPSLTVIGSNSLYLCITNFHITGDGATNTSISPWGTIVISATSPYWRITGNTFTRLNGRPGFITTRAGAGGLIDQNVFNLDQSGYYFRNSQDDDIGHLAWSTNYWATNALGGYEALGNSVYFERNLVTNGVSHRAVIDGDAGMLVVARSNTLWNASIENHGRESGGKYRSGFWLGIYSNQFLGSIGGEYSALIRGGSGMVAGNNTTGSGYPGLVRLTAFQTTTSFMPYGQSHGNNSFDLNYAGGPFDTGTRTAGGATNQFVDSTKSWTVNEWVGYSAIRNPVYTNSSPITGSQSGATVTASADIFESSMVNAYIRFASGQISLITNFTSATQISVNTSRTVNSTNFVVESLIGGLITSNNATTLVFNSKFDGTYYPWVEGDRMAIYRVNRVMDMPGCGPGTPVAGGANTPAASPVPYTWPNQQTNTIYVWANSGTTTLDAYSMVLAARDYTNAAPATFEPLVFPHPFASAGSTPTPRTARATNARVKNLRVNP